MKDKRKPTKPHKREPRKPYENGYPGYVSLASREFARLMYERINAR